MEWVEYMTSPRGFPDGKLASRQNGRDKPWRVPFVAIGNESWGCGGNMRPEYAADNFRRYNTFVKNYSDYKIQRIACGASGSDYK
jgi:alpha-N-arabinofuranosidase